MHHTPYVLIVHGTWNPPDGAVPRWHQLGGDSSSFSNQLHEALSSKGIKGAVWRQWGEEPAKFSWSGANQHVDRIEAGDALFSKWLELRKADFSGRIHVIAHSHGCNVTLRAVQRYLEHLRSEAESLLEKAQQNSGTKSSHQAVEDAFATVVGTASGAQECTKGLRAMLTSIIDEAVREQPTSWRERIIGGATSRKMHGLAKALDNFIPRPEEGRPVEIPTFQKSKFIDAWVTCRNSNGLGKLVFLGAPILNKIWPDRKWYNFAFLIRQIINIPAYLALALIMVYAGALFYWGVLWLYSYPIYWISGYGPFWTPILNPIEWPGALQIMVAFFAAVTGISLVSGHVILNRAPLNLYFQYREHHSLATGLPELRALPIKVLTITAELLDEVFLALSTEPFVYGAIRPQLETMLRPKSNFWRFRLPSSFAPYDLVSASLIYAVRTIAGIVMLPILPLSPLWEKYLTVKLWQLLSSPAFGLGPEEFVESMVVVDTAIRQPDFFDEQVWPVTKILMSQPPMHSLGPGNRENLYGFLWDDHELKARMATSWLWQQRARWTKELTARYQKFSYLTRRADDFEKRLARTCIMLEERVKEMVGIVALTHSSYYTNKQIVESIANFIASGEVPAGSTGSAKLTP